jgi:hypothetical protein
MRKNTGASTFWRLKSNSLIQYRQLESLAHDVRGWHHQDWNRVPDLGLRRSHELHGMARCTYCIYRNSKFNRSLAYIEQPFYFLTNIVILHRLGTEWARWPSCCKSCEISDQRIIELSTRSSHNYWDSICCVKIIPQSVLVWCILRSEPQQ